MYHAHLFGVREVFEKVGQERYLTGGKYHWLTTNDIKTTKWVKLEPQSPFYLFIPQDIVSKLEYEDGWRITDIFPVSSTGVKTHRDNFVMDFDNNQLRRRIEDFRNLPIPDEVIVERYDLQDTRDWKLSSARRALASNSQWESYFTQCLYRPFDNRAYFHHENVVELPRNEVMRHVLYGKI